KQGYGETIQRVLALAVSLFHDLHQDELAFETAARAEGRAFLDLLASRGLGATPRGAPSAARSATLPQAPRELASPESAPAPAVDEIRAAAGRLRSTLLAYFVTGEATYVWVVPPDGPIRAARLHVTAARLTD